MRDAGCEMRDSGTATTPKRQNNRLAYWRLGVLAVYVVESGKINHKDIMDHARNANAAGIRRRIGGSCRQARYSYLAGARVSNAPRLERVEHP